MDHVFNLLSTTRCSSRENRRGAVPQVCCTDADDGFRRAVHKVGSSPAVDMQVDETRSNHAAFRVNNLNIARQCCALTDKFDL